MGVLKRAGEFIVNRGTYREKGGEGDIGEGEIGRVEGDGKGWPTINMGETGEEYSFEVFQFAAKCLVTGCTCSEIARLASGWFFYCFFPKRAGAIRVPGRRQWEEWRFALLLHGHVRVLKLMQKMDLFHIAGDATFKGKSKKSRKTGILQTAGRGVKDGATFST